MNISGFNPELVRNTRIHLRPGRIVAVIVICAVISFSAAAFSLSGPPGLSRTSEDGRALLTIILSLQIVALLMGGGIYSLLSIHREKDLNTFDFQRITRLTPFELVFGKIFGAPIQMYFAFLCLMPVGIWAASMGHVSISAVVMIYLLVVLGSIAYHSFALLLSLVMERGTSAGAIVLFLIIVGLTSIDFSQQGSPVGVHGISPFFVYRLFSPAPGNVPEGESSPVSMLWPADTFFGFQISHSWVLVALYLTLTGWFLLAAVKNIKRDPLAYELYSPTQGFAFSLYLNLLLLGFLRWSVPLYHFVPPTGAYLTYEPIEPLVAELLFLMISLFFFALFGLTLLRNRDQVRQRIRKLGARAAGWWAAVWPAPYLLVGSILAGVAIVLMIQFKLHPQTRWNTRSGLLEAAFFSAWVARDVLYLQWMNLRRARRPIMMAVLYMIVFYACASALFVPLRLYREAGAPYASIFIPLHSLQVSPAVLSGQRSAWAASLALLCVECMVFAWLQRRTLQEFLRTATDS